MKTLSRITLAAVAATFLSTGAAFADHTVRRIDHPNGPATFVATPHERTTTIGVYAGERSFQSSDRAVVSRADDRERPIVLHMGRGQRLYVQGENR